MDTLEHVAFGLLSGLNILERFEDVTKPDRLQY
jgi:hypothetical protein